jgi:AcrR family transcriptional regulator
VTVTTAGSSRRAEYAAETRRAIIDAARSLFAEQGYFATTVDQVAARARVAPGTVYSTVGGKQGLLQILTDEWLNTPIAADGLAQLADFDSSYDVLRGLSIGVRLIWQQHDAIVQILLAAAPHDRAAAGRLNENLRAIRGNCQMIARDIKRRGDLADHVTVERAADILYYYFGPQTYSVLLRDNGWPMDEAADWLLKQCAAAVLERGPEPVKRDEASDSASSDS